MRIPEALYLFELLADPGCRDVDWTLENPQCQDGVNNDPGQDAFIDFDGGAAAGSPPEQITDPDPQCVSAPWKDREARLCGLGFELALLLPPLLWLHGKRRTRRG